MVSFHKYDLRGPSRLIHSVWELQNDADPGHLKFISDGHPDIAIPVKGTMALTIGSNSHRITEPALIGPLDTSAQLQCSPGARSIFVKLKPWAIPLLFHESAKHFRNGVTALSEIGKMEIAEHFNTLTDMANHAEISASWWGTFLSSTVLSGKSEDPTILIRQLELFFESLRELSVNDLRQSRNTSTRYLEKQFEEYIGIPPGRYSRMLRVKKASLLIAEGNIKILGDIAAILGFHDQSHFHREFKGFADFTPTHITRLLAEKTMLNQRDYLKQFEYA